ncbi:uncharacterized protein METZ01_LOCUS180682, partial [marine metagenome]
WCPTLARSSPWHPSRHKAVSTDQL